MIVLGIDPGYDRIGVAIVKKNNPKEEVLFSTCLTTNPKDSFEDRLLFVGKELEKIIKKWKPKALSIEELFFHTNKKTASRVSEARGMIIYVSVLNKLKIFEYTPLEIKTTITGHGRADKEQVQTMVLKLVNLSQKPKFDDEVDAIATALTCLARNRF